MTTDKQCNELIYLNIKALSIFHCKHLPWSDCAFYFSLYVEFENWKEHCKFALENIEMKWAYPNGNVLIRKK